MEISTEFKIGDVVYLKSGSPSLMVTNLTKRDSYVNVCVVWFRDGDLGVDSYEFPSECLRSEMAHDAIISAMRHSVEILRADEECDLREPDE